MSHNLKPEPTERSFGELAFCLDRSTVDLPGEIRLDVQDSSVSVLISSVVGKVHVKQMQRCEGNSGRDE